MYKLSPEDFKLVPWRVAKKVKPLRAKPLINLLVDRSITSKFLVDTLEGKEPLGDGVVICIGEFGDVWQQMPKKLLQKYDVMEIDKDGWMVCQPKPDNAVHVIDSEELFQVWNDFNEKKYHERVTGRDFYIVGQWGETLDNGTKNAQVATVGDFICQNREDVSDTWIVRKKIFNNTYVIK